MVAITLLLPIVEVIMHKFDLSSFDVCKMSHDYEVADLELGFAPIPGSEIGGNKLNEHGMRGPLLPIKKKPGNFRILFLGDSTCWGLGVKLEDSFSALATSLITGLFMVFENGNRK